jgi:hypothetical protein
MNRQIDVVLCGYRLTSDSWRPPAMPVALQQFVAEVACEYAKYGILVSCIEEPERVLEVKGYADLLNTVRLRTGDPQLGNPCLGHVIGQSANCDLLEDLRRGLSRVAFAPETIEPDGSSKRVCHNCGCGC